MRLLVTSKHLGQSNARTIAVDGPGVQDGPVQPSVAGEVTIN